MTREEMASAKQRILEACGAELRVLLEKHGCELVGTPVIQPDGRLAARIELVVKP